MGPRTTTRRALPLARRTALAALALAGLSACGAPGDWSPPDAGARANAARRRRTVASRATPQVDPVARGLFAKNCATCHGLDGSGQGPSVLDRPARNFKDGGFSFGNTADALFNTISSGIPGTPMPAFADALAESDRRRLAAYVRTLGPAVDEVDVADTILTVTDESGPRIVRGILPPIVKGAPIRPRGLLVGLPGGLTFEYRIDDVRLLGVRQGGFVERTDWRDRGGTPLKPLGGLIWVAGEGEPPAMWTMDARPDLRMQLRSTAGDTLELLLVTADGSRVAQLTETVAGITRGGLSGFSQRQLLDSFSWSFPSKMLRLTVPAPAGSRLIASLDQGTEPREGLTSWRIYRRDDAIVECVGIRLGGNRPAVVEAGVDPLRVSVRTPEDSPTFRPHCSVEILRLFSSDWTDATLDDLSKEAE